MKHVSILAEHPLDTKPYDKLRFQRFDGNGTALYSVDGVAEGPWGAFEAIGKAFARYGGCCFYCNQRFPAQPLAPEGVHRDHVIAISRGGTDLLHNLVLACQKCDKSKGQDDIHDFRPRAAKSWLRALEAHIRRSLTVSR